MKEKENIIPICIITDEKLPFTVPALIISVMENASANFSYKFFCFITGNVSIKDRELIKQTEKLYQNCSIEIVDMGSTFMDAVNLHPLVTNACLYKFLIINYLADYPKAIYLDTDIIVNGDISELYNIELGNSYVGGVLNIYYYYYKQNLKTILGINDIESYFNAGVMLMNLDEMRKDNIYPKLINCIGKFQGSVDQHIFNKVCYGRIKNIAPKYNVTPIYRELYKKEKAEVFYTKKELIEAIENPFIFHYTGVFKPWLYNDITLSWKWYGYYRKSPYKDVELKRKKANLSFKHSVFKKLENQLFMQLIKVNDRLKLKNTYLSFLGDAGRLLKRNKPVISIFIENLKECPQNDETLKFIEIISHKYEVMILTSKMGKMETEFKKITPYVYKINHIGKRAAFVLRGCRNILILDCSLYRKINKFIELRIPYIWFIRDCENKQKMADKNVMFSECIKNTKNIIEGSEYKTLLKILEN